MKATHISRSREPDQADETAGYDVLLVEDEEQLANLIACAVRKKGLRVKVTHSNAEACKALQEQSFTLVLLDWDLAGGGTYVDGDFTGACVLGEAKRLDPSLPVLVMSQVISADIQCDAIRLGADAFITKPLSCDVLAHYVSTTVERWNRRGRIGAIDRREDIRPLGEMKREYVRSVVGLLRGNQSEAAERLHISRNTVAAMLREEGKSCHRSGTI